MTIPIRNVVFVMHVDINKGLGAAFARTMCYAHALASKNVNVYITSIVCPIDLDHVTPVSSSENVFRIGNFRRRTGLKKHSPLFGKKSAEDYVSWLAGFIRGLDGETVVFDYTNRLWYKVFIRKLIQNRGTRVYLEKNESLSQIVKTQITLRNCLTNPKFLFIVSNLPVSLCLDHRFDKGYTGIVAISKALYNVYRNSPASLIRIPILADPQKANPSTFAFDDNKFHIGFFGGFFPEKEGSLLLLKAFAKVVKAYPETQLDMYGFGINERKEFLARILNDLNVADNVSLYGLLENEEVPRRMAGSDLLVSAKTTCLQNRYNFSTKLAEYLLSGTACIMTRISDIEDYTEDEKSVILAEPDSIDSLAKRMIWAIEHSDLLLDIGKAGKEAAMKSFTPEVWAESFTNFLFPEK